jgi:hypothetical protein
MTGRRQLLIILAAATGVLYLGLLAYLAWGDIPGLAPLGPTRPPPEPTSSALELWDAYQAAYEVAQEAAQDAQLVSATTQWAGVDEYTMLLGADQWSFVFYSPSGSSVLDVVVWPGGTQVVNQTQVWSPSATLRQAQGGLLGDEGRWREGPRDALLVALAYGGHDFIAAHPQAVVNVHLAAWGGGGVAWSVAVVDMAEPAPFSVVIDAETMQVLAIGE